jgi:hypothetical protein
MKLSGVKDICAKGVEPICDEKIFLEKNSEYCFFHAENVRWVCCSFL